MPLGKRRPQYCISRFTTPLFKEKPAGAIFLHETIAHAFDIKCLYLEC